MRVLLLGSSGFLGRALARVLLDAGAEVEGWSRTGRDADPRVRSRAIDLLVPESFERVRCDAAVLLAGHAVPGADFAPWMRAENERIASHALAHLARHAPGARVIVLSSSHVYAARPDNRPLLETDPIDPRTEYGRSKRAIEALARDRARELDVVVARSFHQIGPSMAPGLLVPDVLNSIARGADPIRLKGTDGERDFLDVRDGARAIAALLSARTASGDVFHVASGRGTLVSAVARGLVQRLAPGRALEFLNGLSPPLVGSRAKLAGATGFEPAFALSDTLDWIAADARARG